jgi:hypothetical protein
MVGYSADDASATSRSFDRAGVHLARSRVVLPLGGRFNVMNALAALTCARRLGIDPTSPAGTRDHAAGARPLRGRVTADGSVHGRRRLRAHARRPRRGAGVGAAVVAGARVIVVFGCGGDRDTDKRPLMGALRRPMPTRSSSPPTTRAARTHTRSSTPPPPGSPTTTVIASTIEVDRAPPSRMPSRWPPR